MGIVPFRAAAVTYSFVNINFFTQDVSESRGNAIFKYYPFKSSDNKAAIAGVTLNVIQNNGPLTSFPMTKNGDFFSASVAAGSSASIDFYYTLRCAPLAGQGTFSSDTKWFTKIMGAPFSGQGIYPLVIQCSGRFRDAHENEPRSDRFPGAAYAATAYTLVLEDYGDSIDLAVFPLANSSAIEIHAFNHVPVDSACKRAEYALNMGSQGNMLVTQHTGPTRKFPQGSPYGPSVPWYTGTIASVTTGELVDFELALTDASSGTVRTSPVNRYYVGDGRLGQEFENPWAGAAGAASVSVITEPVFAYGQHVVNALPGSSLDFLAGRTLFCTDWSTSFLRNAGAVRDCNGSVIAPAQEKSPSYAAGALGPRYLQESCYACHREAGPGYPPDSAGDSLRAIVFLGTGTATGGTPAPLPVYGDMLCYKTVGGTADGGVRISYTTVTGAFDDGQTYSLRKPVVTFVDLSRGSMGDDAVYSFRVGPFLCGDGLLEAVPDSAIMSRADPGDKDGDGISGRAYFAADPVDGKLRLGRFGRKASMPSLSGEIAYLADRCVGLTNRYFPADGGPGSGAELPDSALSQLAAYAALLSPPPRNNWRDSSAIRGKALFSAAGCTKCHAPSLRTGTGNRFHELDNIEIQPFTDLLLHDMGPGLADSYGGDSAPGSEWRTAPLWGLTYVAGVSGRSTYLHDGRARSILEAILWHGGEAERAKAAVLGFSAAQRQDIVAYSSYPFADRLPVPHMSPVTLPPSPREKRPGAFICRYNAARGTVRFFLPPNAVRSKNDAPPMLSIYNTRGQCLMRRPVDLAQREFVWDASSYGPGGYLAEFRSGSLVFHVTAPVVR